MRYAPLALALFSLSLPRAARAEDRFLMVRGKVYRLVPVDEPVPGAVQEARRRLWRRVSAGLGAAAAAAAITFGVLAARAEGRLGDPLTPQVEVPGPKQ
jgi:hypothetical protein